MVRGSPAVAVSGIRLNHAGVRRSRSSRWLARQCQCRQPTSRRGAPL